MEGLHRCGVWAWAMEHDDLAKNNLKTNTVPREMHVLYPQFGFFPTICRGNIKTGGGGEMKSEKSRRSARKSAQNTEKCSQKKR